MKVGSGVFSVISILLSLPSSLGGGAGTSVRLLFFALFRKGTTSRKNCLTGIASSKFGSARMRGRLPTESSE